MTEVKKLITLFIFLFLSQYLFSQVNQQKLPEKTRILFLLDASGSMLAPWENTYRIVAAKRLLTDLVDSLTVNQNLDLALRVYGHQYHRKFQNCQDTKLEVPFNGRNHEQIRQRLIDIKPQGTTPIAYSLQQAANDFPDNNARNIVIIITDGIESCDGDPCAISLALQRRNIFLKPFIIGIGMDEQFESQFGCLGEFFDANNILGFKQALNKAIQQSLEISTVSIELLDLYDQPKETNVNVSFINQFTKNTQYEFVHYLDENGKPDSVEVDPVLNYDLVVNTIPPVIKKNINIEGGRHNIIRVKSPQGYLRVNQNSYTEYKRGVDILIKKTGDNNIIHAENIPSRVKLLVGTYDIEVLTLPRILLKSVEINQSETTHLDIPAPGVLNIASSFPGYGSLYEISETGEQKWLYNLDENTTKTSLAIQPGKYKIVFRSKESYGSKYTQFKYFEIGPGATVNIRFSS